MKKIMLHLFLLIGFLSSNTVSATSAFEPWAPAAPCQINYDTVNAAICAGQHYAFNGLNYFTSGSFTDTLHNTGGCDSLVTLQLVVNPLLRDTLKPVICGGDSFILNGKAYTSSGNYVDTIHSATACDTIVVLKLQVKPIPRSSTLQYICYGDTFIFNGRGYAASGTYNDTIKIGGNGCDSISALNLFVRPKLASSVTDTLCSGDSVLFHGKFYAVAGTYNDTLTGVTGCDSVVGLLLAVHPVVSLNWRSMVAGNYFYAGLGGPKDTALVKCHYAFYPLSGGSPAGGTYSGVGVANDTLWIANVPYGTTSDTITYSFTDTSGCTATAHDIVVVLACQGINDVSFSNLIEVYPNPANTALFVKTAGVVPDGLKIYTSTGQLIYEGRFEKELNVANFSPGAYFIELKSGAAVGRKMFMKM